MPTPVSGPTSIVLHGSAGAIKEIVQTAAQSIFPGVTVVGREQSAGQAGAADKPAGNGSLLVLRDPDSATLSQAQADLDQTGLPRWGVIVWAGGGSAGEVPDALDVIREDGLSTAPLTRILRSAWHRHLLERENWKLRGYLMTFGSRISHDLRTPLGGILTTTEMLREVLLDDAPADVPLIQPILDSTDGLVKLIERSSFFARASSSKEPRRVVDMAMPFWSAYQQVERLMIKSRVTFDHPPSWPKVSGHESWLEIVWGILLRNAVEYSPEGSRIAAGWTALDRDLRFWIRSEGQVRPEKQAGLFFPFQRLHEPGAPRGLGLPMMRGIIELEGGTCGFEAPSSGGVEFFFTLPTVPDLNPTTDSTGVMP